MMKKDKMKNMQKVIWIDSNIFNEENLEYISELKTNKSFQLFLFKNVDEAINYIKTIAFEEIKIIVSGRLYFLFIRFFQNDITDMCTIPKIIVFTKDKEEFLKCNKDFYYDRNIFYNSGGIASSFNEIKKFLNDEIILNKHNLMDDSQLTFEYIDCKEKLLLPILFKTLINNNVSNTTIEKYNISLYEKYSKENGELKKLLRSISSLSNVPIEILSKYYARFYTAECSFYHKLNKDLQQNKIEEYLPFIKTLYEGVRLKSLPLSLNNILYRGSKISNDEIIKIKNYIKNKIKGLPSSIVFSKSFLSFTKDKSVADYFLSLENPNKKMLTKVLFILLKDENLGYNLSTHGDIEQFSYSPDEKEVLFFPFSSFEIKDLKEIKIGKEKGYEIKLLYLGKYLKDIEVDTNIIAEENKIPDSEFKKQLSEFGLIEKDIIININTKILFQVYKKYEENLGKNDFDCDILKNQYIPYIKPLTKEELKKKLQSEELFQTLEKKKR